MNRTLLSVLVLFTVAGTLSAQDYHPLALVAAVQDLYEPALMAPRAPGTQEIDAHLLVRQAHRLLRDDPGSEAAEQLRDLMVRPSVEATDGPRAPSSQGFKVLKTPHFKVLYKTSGNDNPGADKDNDGVPDKARWVADAFENAYKREIEQMGYPAPPTIPNYLIVLKRLKVNALTHPEAGGKTWCEFNFSMREGGTDADIKRKFRAVAAHEFFHAVQALLNWDEADWWVEGSADWMSEKADPGNHFFHANARLRFERPEVGLESSEPFFAYAGSLFAGYLDQSSPKGEDQLKKVWLACGELKSKGGRSGQRSFIKQAIAQTLGPFDDVVTRFWPHVYLRRFPGAQKLRGATRIRVKQYPAKVKADTLPRPDKYGANFFEFHPEGGHQEDTLELVVRPSNPKAKLGVRLIAMGERWESHPVKRSADGTYVARIKGMGGTWRAATLSVVNLGKKVSFTVDSAWR